MVEVLISTTLAAFICTGVMTTFLMLGRSGVGLQNYSQMETEARRALEEFAQDVRMATGITLNGSSPYSSITLTLPSFTSPVGPYSGYSNQVTYAFDNSSSGSTAKCFFQLPGDSSSAATRRVLMRNVSSLTFTFYDRLNASTTTLASIKRVLITAQLQRTDRTAAVQTNTILSASAAMRNRVAN